MTAGCLPHLKHAFSWKLPPSQYGMTQDDTGPCALQKHES
jgi:hypothetical protein